MMNKKQVPYSSKLKGVELLLGSSDEQQTETYLELDTNLIVKSPFQPRRYFDPRALEQLKSTIEKRGILEPLIVRPLKKGKYELVAGERRWRAAKKLKLATVPVTIQNLTDSEAKQIALIENLQRQDLNPMEETEGILELLAVELQTDNKEVCSLLYRLHNKTKGKITQNVLGKKQIEQIESVFESLSSISWQSFVTTRLPLLKLPEETLEALRTGKIAYTKAIEISKIKEQKQREKLLSEAIENNLSLNEIKKRIREITELTKKKTIAPQLKTKELFKKINQKKPWNWQNEEKKIKWQQIVAELEKLMEDDERKS